MLDINGPDRFEALPDFLQACVTEIKKAYPARFSSLQISKRLGIPNSTFDRISKKEVTKPSFAHSLKIVKEACGKDNLHLFIDKFYPKMKEQFERVYAGNTNVSFVAPELEEYFHDVHSYEILMMASSHSGISRELVKEEFGNKGTATLDRLHERELLVRDDNKYFIKGPINAGQETVQKLLLNLISNSYDIENFGNKENWLSLQYESVNIEKVSPKLLTILKNTNFEIRELFSSPENKGDDMLWAGLVMDNLRLSKSNLNSSEVM